MSARQGDGASLRTHLQRRAKNTGETDERLTMQWPPQGEAVWRAFNQMGRSYSMSGPLPLTCQEIEAWQRLYGVRLTSWELEMIHVFDGLRMEAAEKQAPKPQKGKR